MIEKIVAYHCAPALAGIKPANIVACYKDKIRNLNDEIDNLNRQLNGKDIYLEILCECEKRVLLMVYRRKALYIHLQNSENRALLYSFGYETSHDLNAYFNTLKMRLRENSFPHEIGVFLGYPVHDIYGFINNKDEGCLLVGEWKVYQNAESARKLFCRYNACRRAVTKRLSEGKTLAQVFYAV